MPELVSVREGSLRSRLGLAVFRAQLENVRRWNLLRASNRGRPAATWRVQRFDRGHERLLRLALHPRLGFDVTHGRVGSLACMQQLDLDTARLKLRVLGPVSSHLQLLVPAPVPLALRLLVVESARVRVILQVHDLLFQAVLPHQLLAAGFVPPQPASLLVHLLGMHQVLPQVVDRPLLLGQVQIGSWISGALLRAPRRSCALLQGALVLRCAREGARCLPRRREPLDATAQRLLVVRQQLGVPAVGGVLRRLGVPELVEEPVPRRLPPILVHLFCLLPEPGHLRVLNSVLVD